MFENACKDCDTLIGKEFDRCDDCHDEFMDQEVTITAASMGRRGTTVVFEADDGSPIYIEADDIRNDNGAQLVPRFIALQHGLRFDDSI